MTLEDRVGPGVGDDDTDTVFRDREWLAVPSDSVALGVDELDSDSDAVQLNEGLGRDSDVERLPVGGGVVDGEAVLGERLLVSGRVSLSVAVASGVGEPLLLSEAVSDSVKLIEDVSVCRGVNVR